MQRVKTLGQGTGWAPWPGWLASLVAPRKPALRGALGRRHHGRMPSPDTPVPAPAALATASRRWDEMLCGLAGLIPAGLVSVLVDGSGEQRSEERRVGKECRSRWSPY